MVTYPTLLLALVAAATVSAQAPTPSEPTPTFEVASVRPNTGSGLISPFEPMPPDGISIINHRLDTIINYAYKTPSFRVTGMPQWAREERFDIRGKAPALVTDTLRRLMLRSLLIDRFGLRARIESREQTVYVMTRARPDDGLGPGLRVRPDCVPETQCQLDGGASPSAGRATLHAHTMDNLAATLSAIIAADVRNESGVDGVFDAELSWRPDVATPTNDPKDARPSFFTAVEDQLGLKLQAERRPVDVLVIESLQRPTPD